MKTTPYLFKKAVPVWEEGTEKEMNLTLSFAAKIGRTEKATLCLAASTCYLIFVNGKFVGQGPARAGHGYYRVDEIDIAPLLTEETNIVAVRVSGYNINSFCWLDQPSFLCAEIVSDGDVLAYTSNDAATGFIACRTPERIQRMHRYSFQRSFGEAYRLGADAFAIERDPAFAGATVTLARTENKNFIPRGILYPSYVHLPARTILFTGTATVAGERRHFGDYAIDGISPKVKGYYVDELEVCAIDDAISTDFGTPVPCDRPADDFVLENGTYAIVKLDGNKTGLFAGTVTCDAPTDLIITFDEMLTGEEKNEVSATRMGSSVVKWELSAGTHELLTVESYTMQYMRVFTLGSDVKITGLGLREQAYPASSIVREVVSDNPNHHKTFLAAAETFRQNSPDVYMDCPSRERAGWLCDSFFTSRAERVLTGKSALNRNFIENYLLPESFEFLPEGMIPMCYPSDHNDGVFIPNWAMWFVLQFEEYCRVESDDEMAAWGKDRIYALLRFLNTFRNSDGLLEKLPSWVFIEWSHANDLVQDLNYPSNMMYAAVLERVGKLYGDNALIEDAEKMRDTIRKQSFIGPFFCDNAYRRENGALELSGECTETCQYYAFFFGTATRENYPELWETLIADFGPQRREDNKWPEVAFANALVGNYLRWDLLCMNGYFDKFLAETENYYARMADMTGTLWEHDDAIASCNHGFASHVVRWYDMCGLLK